MYGFEHCGCTEKLLVKRYYDCTPFRGEVVVSAGDEEAITCTDIGELLSLCHQY